MCSTASPRVSFTCKPRVSSAGAACSERRRSASRSASFSSCSAARSAALLWLVRGYSFQTTLCTQPLSGMPCYLSLLTCVPPCI